MPVVMIIIITVFHVLIPAAAHDSSRLMCQIIYEPKMTFCSSFCDPEGPSDAPESVSSCLKGSWWQI